MAYYRYLQEGGAMQSQAGIQEQVAQLVQAAMSGDQQAQQQVQQIMQAAQQGDQQAAQIAQMIQAVAQQLQGGEEETAAYKRGGKAPCPCMLKRQGGRLIEVDSCTGQQIFRRG